MNILSLFDGMSCGQLALQRANIHYDYYFASEVEAAPIKITQHHFPHTQQIGDVTKLDTSLLPHIDLLIGGSPCQSFSFAGKRKGMSTKDNIEILTLEHYLELKEQNFEFEGQSYLFWEYMRILTQVKPKYFLLENVIMGKKWRDILTTAIGIEPIEINSALVSAQNRRRLYWTNIPITNQPEDRKIFLKDIIEDKVEEPVFCGAMRGRYIIDGKRQDGKMKTAGLTKQRIEIRYDGKTNTITTVEKDNNVVYNTDGRSYYNLEDCNYRKLTPLECERLQTVPDNYTSLVSKTQRLKMLGNGWTIDVISHILQGLQQIN